MEHQYEMGTERKNSHDSIFLCAWIFNFFWLLLKYWVISELLSLRQKYWHHCYILIFLLLQQLCISFFFEYFQRRMYKGLVKNSYRRMWLHTLMSWLNYVELYVYPSTSMTMNYEYKVKNSGRMLSCRRSHRQLLKAPAGRCYLGKAYRNHWLPFYVEWSNRDWCLKANNKRAGLDGTMQATCLLTQLGRKGKVYQKKEWDVHVGMRMVCACVYPQPYRGYSPN